MNELNATLATLGLPEIGIWSLIFTLFLSLPPLFVLASKRTTGGSKLMWFILTSLFSWIAYALFLYRTRSEGNSPDRSSAD